MVHLNKLTKCHIEDCNIILTNMDINIREEDVGIFLKGDISLDSYTILPNEEYAKLVKEIDENNS